MEQAREAAEKEGKKPPRLPVYEQTPEVREIRKLTGHVIRLQAIVVALAGSTQKPPTPELYQMAEPPVDERKAQRRRDVLARLLPDKYGQSASGERPQPPHQQQ